MFVGRKKELALLNKQCLSNKFEFTVIYGRRRVGKTELIKQYVKDKKAIYYMAIESNPNTNLEFMSIAVQKTTNAEQIYAPYQSYSQLFDHLSDLASEKRIIFVIDEYPYLAQSYPEISSLIQRYCDHSWRNTKLHLILCGSSMSFMENQILGSKSPLYGRRTAQIKVKEFNFFETEEFLKPMRKEDIAVLHYSLGGVAEYLTYVNKNATLRENLVSLFLDDSGRLYEEPSNLLKQELREPKVYNNILDAIAKGASRNNEIATKAGLQTGALNRYIENLIELGIVTKEIPLGERTTRRTIYRIKDGSFRFWYRYVFPNMSAIELATGARLYEEHVKQDIPIFMGEGFEQIFIDYFDRLNAQGKLPVLITQRGRWWGNNPDKKREEEIDLLGIGEEMTILSEVKWKNSPVGLRVITDLIEKGNLFKVKEKFYIIFSKRGFTKGALEYAENRKNMMLLRFN